MTYGFFYKEMKKVFTPKPVKKRWGTIITISTTEYTLEQIYLKQKGVQPLYYMQREGVYYIEDGPVLLRIINRNGNKRSILLKKGNIFKVQPGLIHGLKGEKESMVYFFSNSVKGDKPYYIETQQEADASPDFPLVKNVKLEKTSDFRNKYWGTIETIVSREYCGKKIVINKGTQNSLEVHCQKYETYFIHSGKVKVGLRIGRGENRSVILKKGDVFHVPPGLIHMRIGIEDSVIMEISTKDDDSDSHLIEDGRTYQHKER